MRWLLLLTLLATACTVRVQGPAAKPSSPAKVMALPVLQPLTREQVIEVALYYASERGYRCKVRGVERADQHWEVELAVRRPMWGEMELRIHPLSGQVLRAREDVSYRDPRSGDED
jgi:hypothetical protein